MFKSALEQGNFLLQFCDHCEQYVFYPRFLCPNCGGREMEWKRASGRGVVYSTTTVRRRQEQGGDYNVSIISLEEGPRLMSRVVEAPVEDIRIGLEVDALVERLNGIPALLFRPRAK
jgi:uncharacterized OB-fold protein